MIFIDDRAEIQEECGVFGICGSKNENVARIAFFGLFLSLIHI